MNKRRMREPFHTLIYKASMGYNDSWSDVDQEVLERFAELIVKECIKVAIQVRDDCWTELSTETVRAYMRAQSDDTILSIKNHFGVEYVLEPSSYDSSSR